MGGRGARYHLAGSGARPVAATRSSGAAGGILHNGRSHPSGRGSGRSLFLGAVAKSIPPGRRGAFFRDRQFYGGLLAMGTSAVVGWVWSAGSEWQFPHQFALLFTLYAATIGVAIPPFACIKETAEAAVPQAAGVVASIAARAQPSGGADRNYRRFLLSRILMVIADIPAMPFYVVYAREQSERAAGLHRRLPVGNDRHLVAEQRLGRTYQRQTGAAGTCCWSPVRSGCWCWRWRWDWVGGTHHRSSSQWYLP